MIINSFLFARASTLWNNLVAYYTGDNTPNDSKGIYNGTLLNGATYGTGKINNGFSFDGVNDYISVSPSLGASFTSPSNSHSYSFWAYPNVLSENKTIINNGNAGMGTIVAFGGANIYIFYAGVGGLYNAGGGFSINTWYHIVITYSGGIFKMYKNGSLFSTSSVITWTDGGGTSNTYIGSYLNGSGLYNGTIDELGAWSRALTATEVTELYNSGTGKQYPL